MRSAKILTAVCGLLSVLLIYAQMQHAGTPQTQEPVQAEAIERIRQEALRQSQAMEIARTLTAVYGARLTNSPAIEAAGEYARQKLAEWNLADVRLENWNFGHGWTNEQFRIGMPSDPGTPILAYPKAWTPGTAGPVAAEVVDATIRTEADFERLRGQLRGKFVMILPAPPLQPPLDLTEIRRLGDGDLQTLAGGAPAPAAAAAPPPAAQVPAGSADSEDGEAGAPEEEAGFFAWVESALSAAPAAVDSPAAAAAAPTAGITRQRVTTFYFEEGVAAMIEPGPTRGDSMLTVTATGETNPWRRNPQTPRVPPQVVMGLEDYARIMQMIQQSAPVTLEIDIRNTFHSEDQTSFNVIADIKGTDKADEFVVVGAHLDSWQLAQGATDNAAGVAAVMEAMRILQTLGLPMRRTVRLGLWTGEEQGLLGSRAFIDRYFINRPISQTRPAHSKLAAYFNLDGGTGAIRGIFMQGNEDVKPIFEAWLAPLRSLGVTTLVPGNTLSSDHVTFDNSGLPGFQFLQDPIQYGLTRHASIDTFERLLEEDLMKNAAIVASFIFLAANRDEPLPRKPLPRSIRPAGAGVP